jgi:hypothetical protein
MSRCIRGLVLSASSGRFIWRRRCGLFGIAAQHGFRAIGMVLIIRFRLRRRDHSADRPSLRGRRSGRHLLLYRSGIGIRNDTARGMRSRDVCSRFIGVGSGVTCGLRSCL